MDVERVDPSGESNSCGLGVVELELELELEDEGDVNGWVGRVDVVEDCETGVLMSCVCWRWWCRSWSS